MKRITGRITVITAGLAVTIAALAGTASADDNSFLTTLGQMGHPQSQGTQDSAVNLGHAICDDLADNGGNTTATVLHLQRTGWTMQESADWVVTAEHELCPQYQ